MEIISRADAAKQQLTTYFTGKQCKHGHVAVRNTKDGSCYECCRLRASKFRSINPSYASNHYHADKDRISAQNADYYMRTKEERKAYQTEYYSNANNKIRHLDTCAKWRAKFAEMHREELHHNFMTLAPTWSLSDTPTERDLKYWLAGRLIEHGFEVYKEYYLDKERTSRIDLLVPSIKVGIECKLSLIGWLPNSLCEQRERYTRLLQDRGYTLLMVSLDGTVGMTPDALLSTCSSMRE